MLLADPAANDAASRQPPRVALDVVLEATGPSRRDEKGDAIEAPRVGAACDRRDLVARQIEASPADRLTAHRGQYGSAGPLERVPPPQELSSTGMRTPRIVRGAIPHPGLVRD
jgi:hypothetical protein